MTKINKTDFLEKVYEKATTEKNEYSKAEIERILESVFDILREIVRNGDSITINRLGSIRTKVVKGRTYQIPGTDRTVTKQTRKVPKAYLSKSLIKKARSKKKKTK